jgi:hypothetical protein
MRLQPLGAPCRIDQDLDAIPDPQRDPRVTFMGHVGKVTPQRRPDRVGRQRRGQLPGQPVQLFQLAQPLLSQPRRQFGRPGLVSRVLALDVEMGHEDRDQHHERGKQPHAVADLDVPDRRKHPADRPIKRGEQRDGQAAKQQPVAPARQANLH